MKERLTYSKNVFIPVTHVCRNLCGYCCFRQEKIDIIGRKEALRILDLGHEAGCTEALFSLGERPWEVPGFDEILQKVEKDDLLDYLIELSELALERDLLPHTNAGILTEEEMKRLLPYNASMGLMLETTARVAAHQKSPGKAPEIRLGALTTAGKLKIPFTTGILVGIGESKEDRFCSLQVLADLHRSYGHLQEVIVQPFDPKPGTSMAHLSPPRDEELADTVRMARLVLPQDVAVQIPPNLAEPNLMAKAGATDLGGISPVTSDWINPQKPWPALERMRLKLSDYDLKERLPVYPIFIKQGWHGSKTRELVKRLAGPDGLFKNEIVKDITDQNGALRV